MILLISTIVSDVYIASSRWRSLYFHVFETRTYSLRYFSQPLPADVSCCEQLQIIKTIWNRSFSKFLHLRQKPSQLVENQCLTDFVALFMKLPWQRNLLKSLSKIHLKLRHNFLIKTRGVSTLVSAALRKSVRFFSKEYNFLPYSYWKWLYKAIKKFSGSVPSTSLYDGTNSYNKCESCHEKNNNLKTDGFKTTVSLFFHGENLPVARVLNKWGMHWENWPWFHASQISLQLNGNLFTNTKHFCSSRVNRRVRRGECSLIGR